MSELMSDRDWAAVTRYPAANEDWGPSEGRHAYNEEAGLTPIFHALSRSGWQDRQHEPAARPPAQPPLPRSSPDPVDAFRRDPLTAPIPVQAPVSIPARRYPDVPEARHELSDTGRHHVRRPRW